MKDELLHQTQVALLIERSDNQKLKELVSDIIKSMTMILRSTEGYCEEYDVYVEKAKELGVYE